MINCIVGLGNPGKDYERSPHNLGFRVLDLLNLDWKLKDTAQVAKVGEIILIKPLSYMNVSGACLLKFFNYFQVKEQNMLIIHDDLDLALGKVRYKFGGSSRGHNGLRDIVKHFGESLHKLRIGTDRPLYKSQVADFVLKPFSAEQDIIINLTCQNIAEVLRSKILDPQNFNYETLKQYFA